MGLSIADPNRHVSSSQSIPDRGERFGRSRNCPTGKSLGNEGWEEWRRYSGGGRRHLLAEILGLSSHQKKGTSVTQH